MESTIFRSNNLHSDTEGIGQSRQQSIPIHYHFPSQFSENLLYVGIIEQTIVSRFGYLSQIWTQYDVINLCLH
jgi:hypothetical protein